MKDFITAPATSSATWETLDTFARLHVQAFIQQLLEDEGTELLGRPNSLRRNCEHSASARDLVTSMTSCCSARRSHQSPLHARCETLLVRSLR